MESMGEILYASHIIGGPGLAVYKLDFGRKRWVFVEDLSDGSLFLSAKECIAVDIY